MKNIKYNNKGFSLLELLVGLAISCIVIVSAFTLIFAGSSQYETNNKNAAIQTEVQFVAETISDAVVNGKEADAYVDDDGNRIILNTGNDVLYYDCNSGKLGLYDKTETIGDDLDSHLISDKVFDFEVEFETTDNDETTETTTAGVTTKEAATSNLVTVMFKIKMGTKKVTSQDTYKIRNSSHTL